MKYQVHIEHHNTNITTFLRLLSPKLPYSLIQKAIRNKSILLNQQPVSAFTKIAHNDEIEIDDTIKLPAITDVTFSKNKANWFQQLIITEYDDFLFINKPQGIATHNGTKTYNSIDSWLKSYNFFYQQNLRLTHRLDRDTTGLLLIAKNREATSKIGAMFEKHRIQKTYIAVVHGVVKQDQDRIITLLEKQRTCDGDKMIAQPINNNRDVNNKYVAITDYTTLARIYNSYDNNENSFSVLKLQPITGKTHQLRAHCQYINHAIVGDRKYIISNKKDDYFNMHLHATEITMEWGQDNQLINQIAALPDHITRFLL